MPIGVCNGKSIFRQSLKVSKYPLPVHMTHNDGNNPRLSALMPLEGSLHLDTVAILGIHEVGTDEQENNLGGIEVLTDLVLPFASCANITIMPRRDEPLALQGPQVSLDLVEQFILF